MKLLKKVSLGILIFCVTGVLCFIYLNANTSVISHTVEDLINTAIRDDAKISFKNLKLSGLLSAAHMKDVRIELKNGDRYDVRYLRTEFNFLDLINGKYDIEYLELDSLSVFRPSAGQEHNEEQPEETDLESTLNSIELSLKNVIVRGASYKGKYSFDAINLSGKFIIKPDDVDIEIDHFSGHWKEKKLSIPSIAFEIKGKSNYFNINQLRLNSEKVTLVGKGQFNFTEDNISYLFYIDQADIDFSGFGEFSSAMPRGRFVFKTEIRGDKLGATIKTKIDSGYVDQLQFKESAIESFFHIKQKEMLIKNSEFLVNGARLNINGKIFGNVHKFTLKFKQLDLSRFYAGPIKTQLHGKAEIAQTKLSFLGQSTEKNKLWLKNSTYGLAPIKDAFIEFSNSNVDFHFFKPSYIAFYSDAVTSIKGSILGPTNKIQMSVTSENLQLKTLMNDLEFIPFRGNVRADVSLLGELNRPDLEANVWSDSLSLGEINLNDVNIETRLNHFIGDRQGDISILSNKALLAGMEFNQLYALTSLKSDTILFPLVELRSENSVTNISGSFLPSKSKSQLLLDSLRISYRHDYWVKNVAPLKLFITDSIYQYNDAELVSSFGGHLRSSGFYQADHKNSFTFEVNNLELFTLNDFVEYKHSLNGLMNGRVEIHDIHVPSYSVDVGITDLLVMNKRDSLNPSLGADSTSFGRLDLKMNINDSLLTVNYLQLKDDVHTIKTKGFVTFENGIADLNAWKFDVNGKVENLDVQKYNMFLGIKKSVTGFIDSDFKYNGTLYHPKGKFNIDVKDFVYDDLNVKGSIKSSIRNQMLLLDSIGIALDETRVFASGEKQLNKTNPWNIFSDEPFEITAQVSGDSLLVINKFIPSVRGITGKYRVLATVKGTLKNPYISDGYINLTNTTLFIDDLGNPIEDIDFQGFISNNKLNLRGFKGVTNYKEERFFKLVKTDKQGTLNLKGTIDFSDLLHPVFNLGVSLQSFYANYYKQNAEVFLSSSNLKITGRDTLTISGLISLDKGDIYLDPNSIYQSSTNETSRRATLVNIETKIDESVRVHFNNPTTLTGYDINILTPLGESFYYTQRADGTNIFNGKVEISHGTFKFVQQFDIERGVLDFNQKEFGSASFNPFINFLATHESEEYKFNLVFNNFLSKLDQKKMEIYNQLGEKLGDKSEQQIYSLLFFGKEDLSELRSSWQSTAGNVVTQYIQGTVLSNYVESFSLKENEKNTDQNTQQNLFDQDLKIRSKRIYLGKDVYTQFKFSTSSTNTYIDEWNVNYKISDFLRLNGAWDRVKLIESSTQPFTDIYKLRFQWYREY